MTHRRRVHHLLLLAYLLLGGCTKKEAQSPPALESLDVERFTQSPHLALDGTQNQVFNINARLIRTAPAYGRSREGLLTNPDRREWLESISRLLNMNPLESIDRIVIGLSDPLDVHDPLKNAVIVFVGKFSDPSRFVKGFRDFMNNRYLVNPPQFVPSQHGGTTIYSLPPTPTVANMDLNVEYHLAFPGSKLLVFARTRPHVVGCLDVILGQKPSMSTNPAWQERLRAAAFSAMVWGIGDFPPALNDFIKEHVHTDPELANLTNLTQTRRFSASLAYVERQYVFRAALGCEDMGKATGLKEHLETARKNRAELRLLKHFLGEDGRAAGVWSNLLEGFVVSANGDTATLDLRSSKEEIDDFIRALITPPDSPG